MSDRLGPFPLGNGFFYLVPHASEKVGAHVMIHHINHGTEIHDNPTPHQLRIIAAQFLIAANMAEVEMNKIRRKAG